MIAKKAMSVLLCAGLSLPACPAVGAANGDETLLFFEEEAQVITASRRPQPRRQAPLPVEVITGEELRARAATDLWGLLRYRTGIDVVEGRSIDGNRAIVSVRGLPEEFVSGLLVLVDGRSVYASQTGGVYWEQIPVPVSEIERIEVVRGPNAALYGSNAVLGVINIITRKPAREWAAEGRALGGERGRVRTESAVESAGRRFGFRASHQYGSDDGNPAGSSGVTANDQLRSNKLHLRGFWAPADGTDVEWFAGGVRQRVGITGGSGGEQRFENDFQMIKVVQRLTEDSDLEATASRRDSSDETVRRLQREYQYEFEGLQRVRWADGRLHSTWGLNLRHGAVQNPLVYAGKKCPSNRILRGFAQQYVGLTESSALHVAGALEDSETGGLQPAYNVAVTASPWDGHTFRAVHSRASTIPDLFAKHSNFRASSSILLQGNPDLRPETARNYELGYEGAALRRALTVGAALYYMDIHDQIASVTRSAVFFPSTLITLSNENRDHAIVRGAETSLRYHAGPDGTVYANHTVERISTGLRNPNRDQGTPRNKVNFGGTYSPRRGVALWGNAGYKSAYRLSSDSRSTVPDVPGDWNLDAGVSWDVRRGARVFLAAQNLLRPGRKEFADGLAIPRRVYGGVTFELAGPAVGGR